MANLWLDLKGPILADTVYIGGTLVAKDVTISLPAVTPVTADFKAMKIMRIGRDFISGKSEEPYTPDSSDAQSETTPEPSTRRRETSESEG